MREFFHDLFRLGKKLRDGEVGRWISLLAGLAILVLTVLSLAIRITRWLTALWRRVRGKEKSMDDPEEPEGA